MAERPGSHGHWMSMMESAHCDSAMTLAVFMIERGELEHVRVSNAIRVVVK